jgi:hypothetical protein
MPFFKDLRRRSRVNFHQEGTPDSAPGSEGSSQAGQAAPDSSKSTSTLNSTNGAPSSYDPHHSSQPGSVQRSKSGPIQRSASFLQRTSSKPLEQVDEAPPVPPRPQNLVPGNKRFSSGVCPAVRVRNVGAG